MKSKAAIFGVIGLCLLLAPIGGIGVWWWRSEVRIERLKSQTRASKHIDEVIGFLGSPSYIAEGHPPSLGRELIDPEEDLADVAFYSFMVRRTLPVFIVVKVAKDGTVVRAGRFRS